MTVNVNPYIPSFIYAALADSRPKQLTFADILGTNSSDQTNIASTSSFKYDPLGTPLKSTQQLNVDWSEFQNHTFFSSAEVKVNVAFEQIINGFPFDGSKKETEVFFEKLSGFEKWIFDQFPLFGGQLHFSGTQVGEDPANGFSEELGTWIKVDDSSGKNFFDASKNQSGDSVLNPPQDKSFTIESQIFLPDIPNQTQVVLQKLSEDGKEGFTFYLKPSASTTEVTGVFAINSGSVKNTVETLLKKGKFNHICLSLNREVGNNFLQFFLDEKLVAESKREKNIGIWHERAGLLIGTGSSFYTEAGVVTPEQTLSGAMDELRIFHSYRSLNQQRFYASKGIYSSEDLKLYYRFNEPPTYLAPNPNDITNSIVLDSSGNSLHSYVKNFSINLRQSSDNELNPVKNERSEFKTILFPYHPEVMDLNKKLLSSASIYDQENPNMITKLVPTHYLREGAEKQGFSDNKQGGTIGDQYSGTTPGQGKFGSTQIMLTFLYIWAKFFDEMKLFVEAFKTLRTVSYASKDTIPDNFLYDFVRAYGFYLPPLFNSADLLQYSDGEDMSTIGISTYSLKQVQSQIIRRILINIPDVIRSKGTHHSIKSFLRSVGIEPNSMRIREFGGPSTRTLGDLREVRTETLPFVDFLTSSLVMTPYLSSSRQEPGYPWTRGTIVGKDSTFSSDGLLTSGSWTYEALYKYNKRNINRFDGPQSLARFEVTGSNPHSEGLLLNVVQSGSLYAYIRPGLSFDSPTLKLQLGVDVTNGEIWNVSIGCKRNDSIESNVSSSYFLRAATQSGGEIVDYYVTSSLFREDKLYDKNSFRILDSSLNVSGTKISVGNAKEISEGNIGYYFLNNTVEVEDTARVANFNGQVRGIKFWSKSLSEEEWREHIKNPHSLGVDDPLTNYNFVKNMSGSFEKLRLNILEKQQTMTAGGSGETVFIDFSQNDFFSAGSGFEPNADFITPEIMDRSYFSPYFDEFASSDKVRVRSYQNEENIKYDPWATIAPAYELPAGETPLDDPRLSVEFSLVDTLNKDIINMFASMDSYAKAIGDSSLLFSPDYPGLENLRDVYFNRLSEKMNFRSFFEFFRWFDNSVSTIIQQLVPRKTKFKGTNFVIESHMLERHKIEYQSSEIYLGDSTRNRIRDVLLVQQIVGNIGRY